MSARKSARPRNSRPAPMAPVARQPQPDDPSTWPVIWRVVAPGAGSFGHDMVFTETEVERDARTQLVQLLRQGLPVRLERVACGPLPPGAVPNIVLLRASNAQNPGGTARPVLAAWEARP